MKYTALAVFLCLVFGHFLERQILGKVRAAYLSDRVTITAQIYKLCPQPERKRSEKVYQGSFHYRYQLHCSPKSYGASEKDRTYSIRFKGPYGYFSFQRIFGVTTQEYFETGAWELHPEVAVLNKDGRIDWLAQ